MFIKHLLGRRTLMVGTGATSGVHLDLDGDGEVDTRIHVVQFTGGIVPFTMDMRHYH